MTKHYILQALIDNGRTAYIDDVPNGKNCGCICEECKGKLIAKNKGNIKIHHFAHESGNDSIKCSQTALHLLAKEIIAEEKRIPAFVNGRIEFVTVDTVEQEKNMGDIKPDLYAEYAGIPIAVEIFVSHAVDEIKFAKIQNHKLTTFEIDLSELLFESKEEVKRRIYDLNNIRPIYDEVHTVQALANKKKFIDANGVTKSIINGTVAECPMSITLRGMQGVFSTVKADVCENCPFGYRLENENKVHCIGFKEIELSKSIFIAKLRRQQITVNLNYWCQVNVSKNKVVSLAELADYLTCVTGMKFQENKRRTKKIRR